LQILISIRYLCPMRLFAPLLLGCALSLAAQSPTLPQTSAPPSETSPAPIQVSPQEALAHRIGHDKPIYPRFALVAGVIGTVKIPVTISAEGSAAISGPVTGPPSLLASASAWVNAGKFRPFLRDGQPVPVTTTLPVVFTLPPGAHSAHPPPVLYPRNVTRTVEREGPDSPPRARWSQLSPALHDWLARYQVAVATLDQPATGSNSAFDEALAREAAPPLMQIPGNIALYPVPLASPQPRLYLLFEFSHGCAKTNCPIFLLEDSPAGIRLLLHESGVDVDLHRRDSSYPDLLFWSDSGHAGISNIAGFSYYAGEWGQLYCGIDDANEDSERDEEIADHHGAHVAQPPLVTLCK
jgi:hypothetical protein